MNCHWCRRKLLTTLAGAAFCQYGCLPADKPFFSGVCIDCHLEYDTGKPGTDQCPSCEEKEDRRYAEQAEGDRTSHTGYSADMRRKGAARRVAAVERDAVAVKKG